MRLAHSLLRAHSWATSTNREGNRPNLNGYLQGRWSAFQIHVNNSDTYNFANTVNKNQEANNSSKEEIATVQTICS